MTTNKWTKWLHRIIIHIKTETRGRAERDTREFCHLETGEDRTPRWRSWELLESIPANSRTSSALNDSRWHTRTQARGSQLVLIAAKPADTYVCAARKALKGALLPALPRIRPLSCLLRGGIYATNNAFSRRHEPFPTRRTVSLIHFIILEYHVEYYHALCTILSPERIRYRAISKLSLVSSNLGR